MNHFILRDSIYWSEIQTNLLTYINKWNNNSEITMEERLNLQNKVNRFCEKGTGFQHTLYKFVKQQLDFQSCLNDSKLNLFAKELEFLCSYLDEYYLNLHPKNKKTIYCIRDMYILYFHS